MSAPDRRASRTAAAALAALAAIAGCGEKAPPPKAGPPEVGVITLEARAVPVVYEQVGRSAGFREIEVRPRVSGILQKRLYREGQAVTEGQPLFQIDPDPFKAALDQAKGALRQQEAAHERAKADFERIEPLFRENAVSRKDFDDARAALDAAAAGADAARAKVKEAEINLGYTLVTAPISGVASKEAKSEGSLVSSSGEAGLLTVIAQLDPIYVNFSFSESERLRYQENLKTGRLASPGTRKAEASIRLSDGRDFPLRGHVDFADSRVDPGTGTIRARAEFPNPRGEILPGEFVRLLIKVGDLQGAIVVPERALTQQQATRLVLVVDDKGMVEARPVVIGGRVGGDVVLASGVKPGERVIVDGLLKARPGAPVKPVPAKGPEPSKAPGG
jgi:membrane fusion protein (multidrug efflux system)